MITFDFAPDQGDWDAYVTAHPQAAFSHFRGWGRSLALTYDLQAFFLAARRDGYLAGLVPLILFDPPGGERRVISLPYTDAAGIIADDDEAANRLLDRALSLAAELEAGHLEIRQPGPVMPWSSDHGGSHIHVPHSFKTGLARPLPESGEELWGQISAKVRNQVRKARRCGCRAEVGGREFLDDFYAVFSENMRDLGSPVHSRELFNQVLTACDGRIFLIFLDDRPAAAAMVFFKGTTLFNPWAASLRRFRPSCPNMLLYWSMLSFGAEGGYRRFDFGRSSPGASTCRFKQQWGAEMEPLIWHMFSKNGRPWDPRRESLEDEEWKSLALADSRKQGPAVRRWISL